MTVKILYRYKREDGGVSVTPIEPDQEYTVLFRVIADDGKCLVRDGEVQGCVIDTEYPEGWSEIDIPNETFKEET
ncbi:MAG: hypothetical protein E7667_03480 [Ruminococcaceae bacterium]|nr:hypothetical protein [Oscillospiraceae bacterium]